MMIFPSLSDYYQHSQTYENLLSQLEFNVSMALKVDEKRKFIDAFTKSYLTPHQIWQTRLEGIVPENDEYDEILEGALKHFCIAPKLYKNSTKFKTAEFPKYIIQQTETYCFHSSLEREESFKYPNKYLENNFLVRRKLSSIPPTREVIKNVERFKELFWKIKKAKNNVETWFNLLLESDNYKFIKANVEHRIGFHLWDKKLWTLYIDFLKIADPKEMLQVYSKYCRFFLDDFEMKNEYKNATEKYGPVLVRWQNPFEFEKADYGFGEDQEMDSSNEGDEEESDNENDDDADSYDWLDGYVCSDFTPSPQNWKLPVPIIRYLTAAANPSMLRNLHRTCKYFFNSRPEILCYNFDFGSTVPQKYSFNYERESIDCISVLYPQFNIRKLHITGVFKFEHINGLMLSYVIKFKIYKCSAKFIDINSAEISEKELHFLIGHGKVEYFKIDETFILKENGEYLTLTEMLKMLSMVKYFNYDDAIGNLTKKETLSKLKLINKLIHFHVLFVDQVFKINDFCKFLKKNVAPFSDIKIRFNRGTSKKIVDRFQKAADKCFEKMTEMDGKPIIVFLNKS